MKSIKANQDIYTSIREENRIRTGKLFTQVQVDHFSKGLKQETITEAKELDVICIAKKHDSTASATLKLKNMIFG